MSLIINEFEIVAPPDGAANGDGARPSARASAGEHTAPPAVQPAEIAEILRHNLQRRLRLWAD